MQITIFKIKDSTTGLFSTGGTCPRWTKRGKTWNQINHVKAHLRQFCSYKVTKHSKNSWEVEKDYNTLVNNIPKSWVIVEISASGTTGFTKEYSAKDLYPLEFKNR